MATGAKMPRDNSDGFIQALAVKAGGAKKGTAAAAVSLVGPFTEGTVVIEIRAAGDIRYQTGDADVTATAASHFLAAGERLRRSLVGASSNGVPHTHLAIIRAGAADAAVEVSELE